MNDIIIVQTQPQTVKVDMIQILALHKMSALD